MTEIAYIGNSAGFVLSDGTTVIITRRTHADPPREYLKASRVYAWNIDANAPEVAAARAALPPATRRGEDPEVDRAYDASNRMYIRAWRAHVQRVFAELAKRITLPDDVLVGLRFSIKAGCTCPCSPGGVLKTRVWLDGPVDFYITLPGKE